VGRKEEGVTAVVRLLPEILEVSYMTYISTPNEGIWFVSIPSFLAVYIRG
jgi:hypothetical protein